VPEVLSIIAIESCGEAHDEKARLGLSAAGYVGADERVDRKGMMIVEQKLTGLFTILCPACRERGPVSTGKGFEWSCVHRRVTVVETQDRRFLTLSETSEALV